MTKQTKIKDRKAYMKAYYQRPEVKAYKKDNFLIIPNCKGNSTRMFTNGVTKEMKKMLPGMMNEVALKLLKEKKA
jgi:hypothetical protein